MGNRLHHICIQVCIFFTCCSLSAKSQIDSVLLSAIKNCDIQAVQLRLKNNININATDSDGANILMWAAYYCDVPLVKQLVRMGVQVTDTGLIYVDADEFYFGSPQEIAAYTGKVELLK